MVLLVWNLDGYQGYSRSIEVSQALILCLLMTIFQSCVNCIKKEDDGE